MAHHEERQKARLIPGLFIFIAFGLVTFLAEPSERSERRVKRKGLP
jgi:hypothetical protein